MMKRTVQQRIVLFFELCISIAIFVANEEQSIIHFAPMVASDWIFRSDSYGIVLR